MVDVDGWLADRENLCWGVTGKPTDEVHMETAAAAARMTAKDFFEWVHRPEHRDRNFELERGKVVEVPPAGQRHGYVPANVGRLLGNYTFERRSGYVCTNDTGIILETDPDTVRGIDVTVYDRPARYEQLTAQYTAHLPVLAVEVLSPHDRPGKLTRRVSQFLRKGIQLVWLVDPEGRDVTVYRPGAEPYVLSDDEELAADDLLPGFRCLVTDLFRMPSEGALDTVQ